jgi:small nuclear ribonucleoprotein (snRNP)-like protein
MIRKMLFAKLDRTQLFIVVLGALVGFLFLLVVVHYFGTIRHLASGEDSMGKNLVIAQKKVSKYAAFDSSNASFSKEDLERLTSHKAVQQVAPVVNNQFYLSLAMREEGLPYFSTDIFIQAVDDAMMDVALADWKWDENADVLPLVMPRDFMLMLNQFAASYKIPQVSEEIAKTLNFTIEIKGRSKMQSYKARIVGFSNQMNAVLVPMSFMSYGNEQFAQEVEVEPTLLVLQLDQKHYGDFELLMDELNLEIKENELLVVKIQGMLYVVLSVLFVIALIIVALCGMMIAQFSMLLVSESRYEVRTLLRIGYEPRQIAAQFYRFFFRIFSWILVSVVLLFIFVKYAIDQVLMNFGLVIEFWPSWTGLVLLVSLAFGIVLLNYKRVLDYISKV